MREFWVNSSRETEFNPTHNHGGVLSFVIWMKIPTEWQDQYEIPFVEESNTPMASDFQFLYTDILGSIQPMSWPMDPEVSGTMVVFPAMLAHQVYPFFESDGTRISISGNLYFSTKVLKESIINKSNIDYGRGAPIHKNML